MIPSLITTRGRSSGFKDNPLLPILGRPLVAYPFLAAKHAKEVSRIFLSTEGDDVQHIGRILGMEIIDRPSALSRSDVGHLVVIQQALDVIIARYGPVEIMTVLLGNVATHEIGIVDKCLSVLRANPHVDSCVTVSRRNEYHPLRAKASDGEIAARRTGSTGFTFIGLSPFVKGGGKVSTNRQDLDPVFFINHAVWALRPQNCLGDRPGQWPGSFMGETVVGIETDHGIDIRTIEDVAFSEKWLTNHGWTMNNSPYWQI